MTSKLGASIHPINRQKLLLRPLSDVETMYLRTRDPATLAYQEYFDLSPENTARPIWHQKGRNLNRYYQLCREQVEAENRAGQSPIRIPVLERWEPTKIAPAASHLQAMQVLYLDDEGLHPAPTPSESPSALRQLLREIVTGQLRVRLIQLIDLISGFKIRDYLGYRQLTKRLKMEQKLLPYALSEK
jgi:hypothetical protein